MSGRRLRAVAATVVVVGAVAAALAVAAPARGQEPRPPVPSGGQQPVPNPTPGVSPNPNPTLAPNPEPTSPPGPAPTPQPAPTPPSTSGSGGGGLFGWLNPVKWARDAINGYFSDLVVGSAATVLRSFGDTTLTTPEVTNPGRPRELWGVSLTIANSAFVLLVMVGGMLLMGGESEQSRYTLKDVGPRLVVGFAGANLSLFFVGILIDSANALSRAFLGQGLGPEAIGPTIEQVVVGHVTGINAFLGLVVLVLALVLSVIYVVRLGTVMILVAGAPLCLICHALPHTDGLARLWWRAITGALAVQVVQSMVLVTAMRVFFDSTGRRQVGIAGTGVVDLIVVIALLWVLIRIPVWIGRTVIARSGSSVLRIVKILVIHRALGAALGGGHRAVSRGSASVGAPRAPRPQPAMSGQGTLW